MEKKNCNSTLYPLHIASHSYLVSLKAKEDNFCLRESSMMRMYLSQLVYTLVVVGAEQSLRNCGHKEWQKGVLDQGGP